MPGEYCSIIGCGVCRHPKFKGISIFKLPDRGDDQQNRWRSRFLASITESRVVDAAFERLIENGTVYACQLHFTDDDYIVIPGYMKSRKVLKRGRVPTLNLPGREMPLPTFPRNLPIPKEYKDVKDCYVDFQDMFSSLKSLKSLSQWNLLEGDGIILEKPSDQFAVPEYAIHIDEFLNYKIQVFGWRIPQTNAIFKAYDSSLKKVLVQNLIEELGSYTFCPGVDREFERSNEIVSHSLNFRSSWFFYMEQAFGISACYRTANCEILMDDANICGPCSLFMQNQNERIEERNRMSKFVMPQRIFHGSKTEELKKENELLRGQIEYWKSVEEHLLPWDKGDVLERENVMLREQLRYWRQRAGIHAPLYRIIK